MSKMIYNWEVASIWSPIFVPSGKKSLLEWNLSQLSEKVPVWGNISIALFKEKGKLAFKEQYKIASFELQGHPSSQSYGQDKPFFLRWKLTFQLSLYSFINKILLLPPMKPELCLWLQNFYRNMSGHEGILIFSSAKEGFSLASLEIKIVENCEAGESHWIAYHHWLAPSALVLGEGYGSK